MDSLGTANMSAYASSDPKTTLMNQVRQEAAVQNARQLVEVGVFIHPFRIPQHEVRVCRCWAVFHLITIY